MQTNDQVLVAIVNHPNDLKLARDDHWYRIPVGSANKWLKNRWPPAWLAFYQPKIFGSEAFAVNYFCQVLGVQEVYRWELFPDHPHNDKAMWRYYKLLLGPLQQLAQPIFSRRFRRIVFIPTTWHKLMNAAEINDLYDESPLEDRLWAELKRLRIEAERQEFITAKGNDYALDFAIYGVTGKLNIETDGDLWHSNPERIPQDNIRDNAIETTGWKLLRFNTLQIRERMADYCLPTIVENVNKIGGVDEGRMIARPAKLDPDAPAQLNIFDDNGN